MDTNLGVIAPIAGLPMYDWPDVRCETHHLWACLHVSLLRRGIATTPAGLDRQRDLHALWMQEGLTAGSLRSMLRIMRLSSPPGRVAAGARPGKTDHPPVNR